MFNLGVFRLLVLTFLFSKVLVTSQFFRPDVDGCADPNGLAQCLDKEDQDFTACGVQCNATTQVRNYQDCLVGCNTFHTAAYIGCQIESCWNKVYGCEYQLWARQLVIDADKVSDSKGIPFYPPPNGVDGACSCNLGKAFATLNYIYFDNICINAATSGDLAITNYCSCCDRTRHLSSAINVCPESNLTILNIDSFITSAVNDAVARNFDCSEILNNNQCIDSFGFTLGGGLDDPTEAGTEFYNPTAFPEGVPGTKDLSDVGSFTTFPGPQTTVVELLGYSKTITMVEWKEGKSGGTATAAAGASGSKATGSGGSTSTADGRLRYSSLLAALAFLLMSVPNSSFEVFT